MRPATSASRLPPGLDRLPFYYGWVIAAVACLAIFFSAPGQTFVVSVVVDTLIEDRGWSRTLISGLYTSGSLTAALLMVLVGRMLDRYGGRVMLTVVALLFGLAALWMGRIDEPIHLYIGFVAIRALGQGSLPLISTTLVAIWFVRMRGRVTAMTALAMPASQAAFPPIVLFLISTLGWRDTWSVLALVIWGALLPSAIFLVRRSPEVVGLRPDGDTTPPPVGSPSVRPSLAQAGDWTLGEALRTRAFWLLFFAGSASPLISTGLMFHHMSLIASKGLDRAVAVAVLSFTGPMIVVGTLAAGYLLDRVPNRYIQATGLVILTLAMAWVFVISSAWQAFVYGGVLGLSIGLLMTTNTVIWASYFGRRHLGSLRGLASTGMVTFAALGPLPFGYLFDLTGSYNTPMLVFIALPAVCATLSLLAIPPRKRAALATARKVSGEPT